MTKKLISAAFAVAAGFAVATAHAACVDDWNECAGKPWVDGDVMDTPMGSIWWPHPIWGEGDQAGSTKLVQEARSGHAGPRCRQGRHDVQARSPSTTPACRCSGSASG